jgi:hypothetical protein
MYEKVTVVRAHDAEHRNAISAGLKQLVADDLPGLVSLHLIATAPTDLLIAMSYCNQRTANILRHLVRRRLDAIVGPHVSEPPLRYEGIAERIAPSASPTAAEHDETATP